MRHKTKYTMLNRISIKVVFDRKKVATRATAAHARKGTVHLAVSVNKQRKYISTGVHLFLGQWTGGQVTAHPQAIELNERINNLQAAIIERVNRCDREGCVFCWSMLSNLYVQQPTGTSFTDYIEAVLPDRHLAPGTEVYHRKVLRFLREHKVTDFSQLTVETIQNIDNILHERKISGKPLCQTSIYGYHKVIRSYINQAICVGLMQSNPYSRYKIQRGESKMRDILTMEEVQRIQGLKLYNLQMQKVRDLFLVQIFTGMAYADLMAADFSTVDGDTLNGIRVKTGAPYTTIILEPVKEILRRYRNKLPKIGYDYYLKMLKPLAEMCGIHKDVATHTGRHTFATTISLSHGVPIEVVSKMLGHKSIKTTQIYAKVQDYMVQEQGAKLSKVIG